jgi:hypothetical protein
VPVSEVNFYTSVIDFDMLENELNIKIASVQKIPPCLPLQKGGINDPSLAKRGEGRFDQSKSCLIRRSIL